ncbi:MAG: SurA N-terminal domain-containing protein [SAR86 cluster bacterium]|nr:SurA N-terminal domain-containing protein [SAR86 cluster bacterium]
MMESLRNFLTGPRLFIVIAACALPFVFLGTSSLGSTFQTSLGSVNGENVTEADWQIAANFTEDRLKRIYGKDFDLSQLDEDIQINQIKQELISQKVLLSEARSLGFINKDTDRQAKVAIIKNQSFHLDGFFDEDIYEAQINASGHTKESYIDLMTDIMASGIFRNSLASSGFVTEFEVKELAEILEQTADIDFIKVDFNLLKEQIENSEEEITDFYNSNEILFFSEEERTVKYFILESEEYNSLVKVPNNYVEDAYEEYTQQANNRNEIRFSHIMIEKNNYSSDEDAFNVINEVMLKLNSGDSFSNLAKEFSEDIVSKDNDGDLEYFDTEIFPEEFAVALKNMNLNDISEIVELDDTFHILKITEFNEIDLMTMEQMRDSMVQELINSESSALMNDDYEIIDEMIFSGSSLVSISTSLSKELLEKKQLTQSNFDFILTEQNIKDFIFSPDSDLNKPNIFSIGNSIIVIEIDDITEPKLLAIDKVQNEVVEYLSLQKTNDKMNLLMSELAIAKEEDSIENFLNAYDFLSKESFVAIKRYSSLLPREVISKVFEVLPGSSVSIDSSNGDKYFVDLININKPSQELIEESYDQYKIFSEDRVSKNLTDIVSDEIFNSAKVNLTGNISL